MFLTNVRITTLVLAVSVAVAGSGWLMYQALGDPPPTAALSRAQLPAPADQPKAAPSRAPLRATAAPTSVPSRAQPKPDSADQHADSSTPPIPPEKFAILHAVFKPQPDEMKWRQIPWLASLTEARKKAAEEGKPLYVMSINGAWEGPC
jgi:hypothetical protein